MTSQTSIRGYELREQLGEGAFGTVYRAFQPSVRRDVAIKVIRPELSSDPQFIRRFEVEAQLVARLEHPHIVPLHDFWRDAGGAYLVMRLLGGGSLRQALESGPLDLDQAGRVVREVGGALAAAHRAGVIHRDVKPANILLDDASNAYLSDFGIAKDLAPDVEATKTGEGFGSPAYMSPEQLRAESPSPRTDVYALGLLVYEMLSGSHPFDTDSLVRLVDDQLTSPLPLLHGVVEGVPESVDEVLTKATAKPPSERFADAAAFVVAFDEALGSRAPVATPLMAPNPYKGLRAFQESDAADFFGREALVERLAGRLESERFLAVVGPSGSGKSSAVRAGLIPAARAGAIAGSGNWLIADLVPGIRPFEELEAALLRVAVDPPATLLDQLERDDGGLRSAAKRLLPPDTELLLVIDQFEEIFTLADEDTRDRFIGALVGAVTEDRSPVRVVVTLRADFYDRPLQHEALGELMRTRTETVLPLGRDELERAIRGPAERVGVPVEGDLIPEVAADLSDEPGALPLLQYALTQTFEARRGGRLSAAVYREVGGIARALGDRAEELFLGLDVPARETARQALLRLVNLGEGTADTRRRVRLPDLEALGDVRAVIDRFGEARLLSFDHEPDTRTPTVEVAHEALLTEWDRLRSWIDESRDDLRTHRRLAEAAADWQASELDASFLLTGSRLDVMAEWVDTTTLTIDPADREYLAASIARRVAEEAAEAERLEQEQALERRSRTRLRVLVAVMAAAAVVAAGLTAFAFSQRREARDQAAVAAEQTDIAESEAAFAAEQQAEAERQAAVAAEQTAEAERQAGLAAEQQAVAEDQRDLAERAAAIALTRRLIAESAAIRTEDPELSLLLAVEAVSRTIDGDPLPEAATALSDAVQGMRLAEPIVSFPNVRNDVVEAVSLASGPPAVAWAPLGTFGFDMIAAFSPAGDRLAAVTTDQAVGVWDTVTGDRLATVVGPAGEVRAVTFSPDGSLLVIAGRAIQIVDAASFETVTTVDGGGSTFLSVDVSQDRRTVVAATADGAAIFDVESGVREDISGAGLDVAAAILVPDSGRVAMLSSDGQLTIWDPETGESELLLEPPGGCSGDLVRCPYGVRAVDAAGKIAFTEGTDRENELIFSGLLDLATSEAIKTIVEGAESGAVFSDDLGTYITVGFDGDYNVTNNSVNFFVAYETTTFDVFNTQTERRLGSFTAPSTVWADLDPTGTRLLLSDGIGGEVRIVAADTGIDVFRVPAAFDELVVGYVAGRWSDATGGRAEDALRWRVEAHFGPSGRTFVTCCTRGQVTLWDSDPTPGGATAEAFVGSLITDIAVTRDGAVAVAANTAGIYRDGTRTAALDEVGGLPIAIAAAPGLVAVTDGTPRVFAEDGRFIAEIDVAGVTAIALDANGSRLATAADRDVAIWDPTAPDEPVASVRASSDVTELAFSVDGTVLYTTGSGGVVEGWSAIDGSPVVSHFLSFTRNVDSLAVHPDGRRAAASNNDGTAILLDLESGEILAEVDLDFTGAGQVAYDATGSVLAVGSPRGEITLLDPDTLAVRFGLRPGTSITALGFGPDGLVVTDVDGWLRTYPATFDDLLALAGALVDRTLTDAECEEYLGGPCDGLSGSG